MSDNNKILAEDINCECSVGQSATSADADDCDKINNAKKEAIKTSIGGQALIEGIMMRGPKKTAMAVRNTENNIVIEEWDNGTKKTPRFFRLPIFRGLYNLVASYKVGIKCLMRSAEISGLDDEAPLRKPEMTDEEYEREKEKQKKKDKGILAVASSVGMVLGVVLAVFLFIYLPTFFGTFLLGKNAAQDSPVALSVISGLIKVVILVAYMALVSFMKDIRRTFMYHGAEHKTIFCYERGLELTVENVRKQKRFHPRCGTSFLILMVLVGIAIMIPIGIALRSWLGQNILENKALYTLIRSGISLVLFPLMAGIGYELIKIAGRHDNIVTKIISAPGTWLQRITTKEPDDSMIECAIEAVKRVIPDDGSDKW